MRPECPLDTTSRSDNMRRLNHTNLNMTFYGQHKLENPDSKELTMRFCFCGCGQEVSISTRWGAPNRYINGHQGRRAHQDRFLGSNGRWYTRKPDHPKASPYGFVQEHIVIAEQALGYPLPPNVEVHHADENPANNISNLVICQDSAYHKLLHVRRRALIACGNPGWRKCRYCHVYDDPANMQQHSTTMFHHRTCKNKFCRDHYKSKSSKISLENTAI